MDSNGLLEQLRGLETELHRIETRRHSGRMDSLLHPDFVEVGRSGRYYSRKEVLEEFLAGGVLEPVHAQNFELEELGQGIALLTYRSAHVGPSGDLFRHTLRTSLWIETAGGWRMRFHQGTPVEAGNDNRQDTRTSLTDSGLGYELSVTYPVSRERLFSALTDETVLKRIWRVQKITVDARVGGTTSSVYVDGGQDWSFTITYTEIVPNHTLKWITRFRSFPTKETRVTVLLTDAANGAELTVRMENFETAQERDANKQAWQHGLATLAELLNES
jgi:uncharacterized protein YndB with AHSA1/START domain